MIASRTRLLIGLFSLGSALSVGAVTYPELTGRVVDQAGILSESTEAALTQILAQHEQATSNQVVVATVQSLEGMEIRQYGIELARLWQIGQKDINNGVLLLIAPNEQEMAIEVGYGLEGELTDAMSAYIRDRSILPAFRAGDYERGIVAGTQQIIGVLGGELEAVPPPRSETRRRGANPVLGLFPLVWFFIIFVFMGFRRRGRGRGGGGILAGFLAGSLLGGAIGSSRSHGGFGGLSGGGGFGGFSGGGGSFGGGGASGSW